MKSLFDVLDNGDKNGELLYIRGIGPVWIDFMFWRMSMIRHCRPNRSILLRNIRTWSWRAGCRCACAVKYLMTSMTYAVFHVSVLIECRFTTIFSLHYVSTTTIHMSSHRKRCMKVGRCLWRRRQSLCILSRTQIRDCCRSFAIIRTGTGTHVMLIHHKSTLKFGPSITFMQYSFTYVHI